jgi:hypothetical protein
MNQNKKSIKIIGIMVALLAIAAIVIALDYRSEDEVINENESAATTVESPLGKVAAANIEDGEYYATIQEINENPEDTTITFKHVMYFEGEAASSTAAQEGKSGEVKNGVYVRESGAPSFTAPLSSDTNITAAQLRATITDPAYKPAFKVIIKEGAVVKVEEVTSM